MSEYNWLNRFDIDFNWQLWWVVIYIGGLNLATRTASEQVATPVDPTTVFRVVTFVAAGCFLCYLLVGSKRVAIPRVLLPLLAFAVWQVATTVWSVYPLWTLYRSLEYAVVLGFGIVTAHALNDDRDLWTWANLLFGYYFGIVVLAWVGALLVPEMALIRAETSEIPYMLSSVVPQLNPNSVSQVAAVAGVISFSRYEQRRNRLWLPFLLVSVLTMVASQGRSGMAGFVVGIGVLAITRGYLRSLSLVSVCGLAACALISPLRQAIFGVLSRGQALETVVTLSGRTHKWLFAFDFMQSDGILTLLFGYGAYAGARFVVMPNDPRVVSNVATSTHSTWMDLWTDTGLVGVVLFAIALAVIGRYLVT